MPDIVCTYFLALVVVYWWEKKNSHTDRATKSFIDPKSVIRGIVGLLFSIPIGFHFGQYLV